MPTVSTKQRNARAHDTLSLYTLETPSPDVSVHHSEDVARSRTEGEVDDGEASHVVLEVRRVLARHDADVHGAAQAHGHDRLPVRDFRVDVAEAVDPDRVPLRSRALERDAERDGVARGGRRVRHGERGQRLEREVGVRVGAAGDVVVCGSR